MTAMPESTPSLSRQIRDIRQFYLSLPGKYPDDDRKQLPNLYAIGVLYPTRFRSGTGTQGLRAVEVAVGHQ